MKSFILSGLLLLISCKNKKVEEKLYPEIETTQTPEALGQEIFDGKGTCYTCHKEYKKTIGPSINEIAQVYKNKNASIVQFLKDDSKPIVDPSQYETMKTNFVITKSLSETELKALEAYILSYSK
jgi:cytochrome c